MDLIISHGYYSNLLRCVEERYSPFLKLFMQWFSMQDPDLSLETD